MIAHKGIVPAEKDHADHVRPFVHKKAGGNEPARLHVFKISAHDREPSCLTSFKSCAHDMSGF
ncbi:hypothetical protein FHW03_002444 [Ochrobactrum sp. RH2CCR150]|nr:hypothetical protein [Ochrobactrum sp. RH2CCR150]